MFWCIIFLTSLFYSFQFEEIEALLDFDKPIQISCVSHEEDKKFRVIDIGYDPEMAKNAYEFPAQKVSEIRNLIGDRNKIIFFFLGHEDKLYNYAGRNFKIAKEQMSNENATVCTVSYDLLSNGSDFMKYLLYFTATLTHRIPRVNSIATAFIRHIVDSKEIKIDLSSVYLTGFCLGGHVAGMVGYALKQVYKGNMVPAIWAFDPPKFGFSYPSKKGKPRHVQKGDAEFVVIFHTSTFGLEHYDADANVIVNYGKKQPGCENEQFTTMFCDHFVAFILHELIVLESNEIPQYAHNYGYTDKFDFKLTDKESRKYGKFYLRTNAVFDD